METKTKAKEKLSGERANAQGEKKEPMPWLQGVDRGEEKRSEEPWSISAELLEAKMEDI